MTDIVAISAAVPARSLPRRRPIGAPTAVAVLAGELSLVPTLLPRRPWVQGIFTGIVMANTYAVMVVAAWLIARARRTWGLRRPLGDRQSDPAAQRLRTVSGWAVQVVIVLLA